MDVITILQPDNQVSRMRSLESVALPSFSFFREMPVTASFPVMFLLFAAITIGTTPFFQQKYGFYRLDKITLPADNHAETAMRQLASPEIDASLLDASAVSILPVTIQTVSFSSYTVRNGDTVGAILSRSGLRNMSSILSINNIANARRIRSGQILKVPSMDGILYTVSRGDSLERIALRFALPVNAILDANDLSKSVLTAKQTLFIPGASLSIQDLRRAMGELFILPITGRLTSRFGYRKDPFTGVRTFHTGIDLASPTGTPVRATLDGKVATTGYSTVYGNYVIITHAEGYQSLYGHLSSIGVKRGQNISQGNVIGKVGNTGYSTGSHLHLSLYKNGKMIDPYSVL